MHVENGHGMDELRRMARGQRDARMRIRLQAVVLGRQGRTAEEIAESLDVSRRAVQKWVHRYNRFGVDGLRRRLGQGRREKLSLEEKDRLCSRIEAGPREDDEVCTLRAKDVQQIVKKRIRQVVPVEQRVRLAASTGLQLPDAASQASPGRIQSCVR